MGEVSRVKREDYHFRDLKIRGRRRTGLHSIQGSKDVGLELPRVVIRKAFAFVKKEFNFFCGIKGEM